MVSLCIWTGDLKSWAKGNTVPSLKRKFRSHALLSLISQRPWICQVRVSLAVYTRHPVIEFPKGKLNHPYTTESKSIALSRLSQTHPLNCPWTGAVAPPLTHNAGLCKHPLPARPLGGLQKAQGEAASVGRILHPCSLSGGSSEAGSTQASGVPDAAGLVPASEACSWEKEADEPKPSYIRVICAANADIAKGEGWGMSKPSTSKAGKMKRGPS